MILDSSAIVGIILRQPAHRQLIQSIQGADVVGVGTPTLVEAGIVLSAKMEAAGRAGLSQFLADAEVTVIPFLEAHWREAVSAFVRFGKGRHPAALNFGDCCSYAIAKVAAQPLLCVGNDFAQMDLPLAMTGLL